MFLERKISVVNEKISTELLLQAITVVISKIEEQAEILRGRHKRCLRFISSGNSKLHEVREEVKNAHRDTGTELTAEEVEEIEQRHFNDELKSIESERE